jgi:hypothetical protein
MRPLLSAGVVLCMLAFGSVGGYSQSTAAPFPDWIESGWEIKSMTSAPPAISDIDPTTTLYILIQKGSDVAMCELRSSRHFNFKKNSFCFLLKPR